MSRPAGTKNATPLDLASITLTDEEIPTATRATKANPFAAIIAPLAATFLDNPDADQKAKGFDVALDKVESTLRLLGNAGRDAGVTIRKSVHYGDTFAHVSFWLAPIQHRTRVAK